jgi:hypothetical protein
VNARAALAFAGGAAVAAALDGAARTLTAAPPAFTLCAGVALIVISVRAMVWRTVLPALLAGACAGLWLTNAAPSGPRDIGARAPHGHIAADLFDALDSLDANPGAFDGRTIEVSGTWTPASAREAATVSRRVMSCCAADAMDVGFDVKSSRTLRARPGAWVRVSGHVRVRLRDGEMRYEIEDAVVRPAPPP